MGLTHGVGMAHQNAHKSVVLQYTFAAAATCGEETRLMSLVEVLGPDNENQPPG